jgi:NitT/TauT family transport system permease protein
MTRSLLGARTESGLTVSTPSARLRSGFSGRGNSGWPREAGLLLAARIAVLAVVVIAWQLAASNGLIPDVLSRTPGQVAGYLKTAFASGELGVATWATMQATLLAFVLAGFFGVVAGVGVALLPRFERVISPFLDALNAMPRIALAPLFVIYFGIDAVGKVALGFSIAFFVVMSSAQAGVRSADPEILRLSRVLDASQIQVFTKVLIPSAVPSIFAGLRLGLIYSLLGVVTSEIMGSRLGLGQLIMKYSGVFQMESIYGILIVLAVLASLINIVMSLVESKVLRWRPPADR